MYIVSKAGSKASRKGYSQKWNLNDWTASNEKSNRLAASQYQHSISEGEVSERAGNASKGE
jgi:hypothetical protein